MKYKQHIIDCLRGKNPDRDLILVEKRIPRAYAVPSVETPVISTAGRNLQKYKNDNLNGAALNAVKCSTQNNLFQK